MNQNLVYQDSLHYKDQDIVIDLGDSNQHNFYISLSNSYQNSNHTSPECDFDYNYQDELLSSSKIVKKQQAFENFSKSKSLYQQNQNIQITLFDNNYSKALGKLEKNRKSVHFNLENNKIQLITNFDTDYYMSFEERKALYQPFSIHKQKIFLEDEDLFDDEDDEQFMLLQNNSINVIVVRDKTLKGILKQNNLKEEPLTTNEYLVMNITQQNFPISQETIVTKREKLLLEKKIEDHQYGIGLKFLKKYGFECGSGLGLKKQGILEPVQTQKQTNFSQNLEKKNNFLQNIDCTNRKKRKIELIAVSDDEQEYCQNANQKSG
ncbi:unnamed protein product [Paramecium primaurelia]|uniref:G-patch domain-containing protein n=1 Tax=Paramecium primaurelia TaxID=5886 RepID=A0A8S1LZC9_PARPR|nr:unnamed protein product [Paramecium primaurelia]